MSEAAEQVKAGLDYIHEHYGSTDPETWPQLPDTLAEAGHDVRRVPVGTNCAVHRHREYVPLNVHHIHPVGLGGQNVAANRVTLCMNAHGLVHEAIRRLIDNNGTIPEEKHFGVKVVALARRGWEESGKPTHGNGGE